MSVALVVGGFGFTPRAGSAHIFAETALGGVVGFATSATGSAGFDYTGRKKLLWDGENMKITNFDEANQFVTREYRSGWEV